MLENNSFQQFCDEFSTQEKCQEFLVNTKWGSGFKCRRCEYTTAIKGKSWHYRKCGKCKKEESCTARTLFHKIKFPLPKAFEILYILSTEVNGMSCKEISRKYNIHRTTAWFFRSKVQRAMSEGTLFKFNYYLRKNNKLFDKSEHKKIQIDVHCQFENRKLSMKIIGVRANFPHNRKHRWQRIKCDFSKFENVRITKGLKVINSFLFIKKDNNIHNHILNFKLWISNTHHLVSLAHVERYFQEFQYRLDRMGDNNNLPFELIQRFVIHRWMPYKLAKAH